MSNPLDAFVELANAQGPAYPQGAELPWTAARPRDFELFSTVMMGRDYRDTISAGTSVKTQFDPKVFSSGFGPVKPASDLRRGSESAMHFMETPFVEYRWREEITRHMIGLQPSGIHSDDNVQAFWKIKEKRDKDFVLDPIIKMDQALSATPGAAMFDDNGTGIQPIKSLFAGVNVWEKRHYAAQGALAGGENLFPGMTSQQGLDPDDAAFKRVDAYGKSYANGGSQLAPTKVTYTEAGNAELGNNHLFPRMKFWLSRLNWKPIPMAGSFGEGQEVSPNYIHCTDNAIALLDNTSRAHGNFFATMSPTGDPGKVGGYFGGKPLMACDALHEAALYPDISGGVGTAADAAPVREVDAGAINGAYFYAFDPRTIDLNFASMMPWSESEWMDMLPLNKDVMFRYGEFMGNIHFNSFVQNGILMPTTDIPNYAIF
jgi:hypothetical protein